MSALGGELDNVAGDDLTAGIRRDLGALGFELGVAGDRPARPIGRVGSVPGKQSLSMPSSRTRASYQEVWSLETDR